MELKSVYLNSDGNFQSFKIKNLSDDLKDKIERMYFDGQPIAKISRRANINRNEIRKIIFDNKIKKGNKFYDDKYIEKKQIKIKKQIKKYREANRKSFKKRLGSSGIGSHMKKSFFNNPVFLKEEEIIKNEKKRILNNGGSCYHFLINWDDESNIRFKKYRENLYNIEQIFESVECPNCNNYDTFRIIDNPKSYDYSEDGFIFICCLNCGYILN